ncbi:MAG: hypothetical protein L6Q99_04985 [Planctomycetes bacterium]|nr:hypothetical protein [Planctomycetota bacterium]
MLCGSLLRTIVALTSLSVPLLAQATWYVDVNGTPPGTGTFANPYTSIQYAIDRPTTLSGDLLSVAMGTYFENIDYHGKSIGIDGEYLLTTISGAPTAPTVRIASGEGAGTVLKDVVLTGGGGELVGSSLCGGGLFVDGSRLILSSCHVLQCGSGVVDNGSGIYARSSQIDIQGCFVRQNLVNGNGAGAYFEDSTVKIIVGEWWGNVAGDSGGAWYANGGTLWAQGFVVHDNSATNDGGGMVLQQCGATLDSVSVSNNDTTYGDGGAIAAIGGVLTSRFLTVDGNFAHDGGRGAGLSAHGSRLAIVDSTFAANVADNDHRGGGAYLENATGMVLRSTFDGNSASDGGGAFVTGGTVELVECELLDNTAQSLQAGTGSGGGLHGGSARSSVFHANHSISGPSSNGQGGGAFGAMLERCTLVANTADASSGSLGASFANSIVTNSISWGNLPLASEVSGTNTVTYCDTESGAAGVGNFSAVPQFVSQGGGDFHLLVSSPCIDAGDPASAPDPNGSLPDLGAFPFGQANCGAKLIYCKAKTNSLGCVPAIAFNSASPSVTGGQLIVSASNVRNQRLGLLFFGFAPFAASFQGGTLCVAPAVTRTPVQSSGGSASGNDCTGTYSFQWTAAYFASKGIGAGNDIFAQYWSRDPGAVAGTGLTDAAQFTTCP